jgi:CRP-like cAMP-binding protein
MPHFDQSNVCNLLLKMLPPEAFQLLRPHMERVDLPLKHSLVEAGVATTNLCFIERGLGSVVATTSDGEAIECGHIGFERLGRHPCVAGNR